MAQNQLNYTQPDPSCAVVVIGGSTGSIEVLLHLLPALQPPLSFAVVIIIHRKNTADSTLATVLALKTALPLHEVDDKDPLQPGHIYLAPADYHLLFEKDGTCSLDDSEKVHYSRPSIDVTFESAADVWGPALVGVLLSGANADGTHGLRAIKQAGGTTVVQRPESALADFMPRQAMLHAPVDAVLDPAELAAFVAGLNGAGA